MDTATLAALNKRAEKLGYEIVMEEDYLLPPSDMPGEPYRAALGGIDKTRIYKDGEPCFKFTWNQLEIEQWLFFRERDARAA